MLSTYRVLDLTDDRGALAGFVLAALGAEVVAVEPPDGSRARRTGPFVGDEPGPDRSLVHWAYGRGKRSVTLDSVDLDALAADADVLIESGAVDVDLEALRRRNPSLVTVSVTPFGTGGPKDDWAATDITIMASGGPMALTGDDDRPPLRMSVPQAYLHAASDAACGALLALHERARSGLGQHVEVSAQASVAQCTQSAVLCASFNASQVDRFSGGVRLGPIRVPLVFPATDGHVAITFVFGTAIGPVTARLMEWVHEAGFCDEATRDADWVGYGALLATGQVTIEEFERVKASVAAFTSAHTKAELFKGALDRRLLLAPVTSAADVMASDQLAARGYWDEVEVEGSPARLPGAFAKPSATPLPVLGRPPRLGEHNGALPARPAAAAASAPQGGDADRDLPLRGIKVLDLMWVMAGPAITRVLADFGATVVRVESNRRLETARTLQPFWNDEPTVDGSGLYQNMNAGKLGITVDLTTDEGREVVLDLARWADVVTESFSPGVLRNLGLDYERLRAVNPDIVMLSSCLMGQTGPLTGFAGYGNLAAALCGFVEAVGWPDRPPSGPFGAYTDYVSPRFGLATLLAALDHRRRTGQGQYIDFSQAESSLHFLAPLLLDFEVNGRVAARIGNDDPAMAPHGVYPAAGDDRWVAVACETDDQWRALAGVIGRHDLAALTAAERLDRRRELDDAVASWTAGLGEGEAQAALQAVRVPAHAVQNSRECRADPQLEAIGHFVATEHATFGTVELEGPRCRLSATPGRVGPAPTMGQHLMQVLQDVLGYDEDRVTALLVSGALE